MVATLLVNNSATKGGAIACIDCAYLLLIKLEIVNCSAKNGGAVYAATDTESRQLTVGLLAIFSEAVVSGNIAKVRGGAGVLQVAYLIVDNSTITHNKAK